MTAFNAVPIPKVSFNELAEFSATLIRFPTDSQSEGNLEFEPAARACLDLIASSLAEAGIDTEVFSTTSGHPTLLARLRGTGGGRTLVLNGHIDVVPPGDPAQWRHNPWQGKIAGGVLHGRGASDMKAGVAALVFAARAIAASGARPAGDIVLHIVSDEEVAGTGSREAIARGDNPSAVISCEPTDLGIVTTHGGLLHLRIEVVGQSAHAGERFASLYPGHRGTGVNAIEKAFKIATALQDLERQWSRKAPDALLPAGFNTISPGIVLGGPGGGTDGRLTAISSPGTTPDYCSLEYNVWYLPDEQRDDVIAELQSFLDHVCQTDDWLRVHAPRLTWGFNGIDVPPAKIATEHPLTEALRASLFDLGRETPIEGFTAASELGWYADRGIPGLLFGPGRISEAHSLNEHVQLKDIKLCAQALIATCLSYCVLSNDA
jgi:acetylornithine deacetylase/succinyl-diaminopimelate desuccinylase family protein